MEHTDLMVYPKRMSSSHSLQLGSQPQDLALTLVHIGLGQIAMAEQDRSSVCLPVGSELEFSEPVRWSCGAVIKPGYRLARTFVDESEDAPFKDKVVLDGQREVCLAGLPDRASGS